MRGSNVPDAEPLLLPMPSVEPGAVAASIGVAAAMGFVALGIVVATASIGLGIGTGLVGGLATPMWTVAASALWQHGPGAFWVALGLFLAARGWWGFSGLAFAGAVMTRPHLMVIGAAVGVLVAWRERRWRPVLAMGSGSAAGVAGLLLFNLWLWGRLTISGGYSSGFAENLASADLLSFAKNVMGALIDPYVGLLVVTPFLVPLLLRLVPAWRELPVWAKGAALGGCLYLLIQYKANRFSGGGGFAGYRYPLEAMVGFAPLFAVSYRQWVAGRRLAWLIFWLLVALATFRLVTWWI